MLPSPFRNPAGCVALLFPLVAVFDNKMIPMFMIGVLAGAVYVGWPWKVRLWPPLVVGFGALLAWSLLSALWSIDPATSLGRFGRLLPTVVGGVILCMLVGSLGSGYRNAAERGFAAGLLIASVIAVLRQMWLMVAPTGAIADILYEFPVVAYGSIAGLSVFVLLATLDARPFPRLTLAAIAAAIVAVGLCGSVTSAVAFVIGGMAFAATMWVGRKGVRALAVLLPVLFLAMPSSLGALDLPAQIKAQGWIVGGSIGHRLIIWRYVSDKIEAKPLLGWGLYTARLLSDRENRADTDPYYADIFEVTWFSPGSKIELMPLHPHNATLQLWLELGFVGVLLYAPLYALCLLGLLRASPSPVALAAGTGAVAAAFVIGQLSFSVWQSWWLCVQFLIAAFYLGAMRRNSLSSPSG